MFCVQSVSMYGYLLPAHPQGRIYFRTPASFGWSRIDTSAPKNKNKVTVLPLQTAIPSKTPWSMDVTELFSGLTPKKATKQQLNALEKELKRFEQSKPTAAQLEEVIKSLRAK